MKYFIKCDFCGKEITRYESQLKKYNFCSRICFGKYNSKTYNLDGYKNKDFSKNSARMRAMNAELNATRMTLQTREKLRVSRLGKGSGKTYEKTYGRHTHRIVAEQMLGRPLRTGEVVHHIDRDKRNNTPNNLMGFPSQKEHVAWHHEHDKEVML